MSGGYAGIKTMQKLFVKRFSRSRYYRKCSGQELDSLMAVLKVDLRKAVKCLIGTMWNLGGLLINFANKQCLK